MAQYKVPQDVEADDKLLGPFNFRQFVYLMIAGALLAVAVGLFQLFPLLAIIPLPPMLFFLVLALPLKRDQPMETYLAAIASYYMKPRTRTWKPGQRETTIVITAPKKQEAARTRDITGEEATHRLSFLADIVDTEGYAIKGINNTAMREDFVAESAGTKDMFESQQFSNLATTIQRDENERHSTVVEQMQGAINAGGQNYGTYGMTSNYGSNDVVTENTYAGYGDALDGGGNIYGGSSMTAANFTKPPTTASPATASAAAAEAMVNKAENAKTEEKKEEKISPVVVMPEAGIGEENGVVEKPVEKSVENSEEKSEKTPGVHRVERQNTEKATTKSMNDSIMKLMNNNKDYSVKTLADQVKRLKGKEEGEIFISLH